MEQESNQQEIGNDEGLQPISTGEAIASEEQPKLYTEGDLKAARQAQGKSDTALSESLGILAKLKAEHEDSVEELNELRQEIERKDDQAFDGEPEARRNVRLKRELSRKEKDLARREKEFSASYKEKEEKVSIAYKEMAIKQLSSRYGISPSLLEYAGSYEEAEELAAAIKAERSKGQPVSGFRPDSGVSDTGGGSFTRKGIGDMSVEEYATHADAISKALREGKIK